MTSYASEMPESPGCITPSNMYSTHKPVTNPYEEQKQQLTAVQEENARLKASLTRVQNECDELRDESNYQRAKVSELSDLVAVSPAPSSFPQSHHSAAAESQEFADETIHKSLIEKSLQNAELTLNLDKLRIELHRSEAQLKDLQLQKKANSKLLLEMGDVIRTLNSIDIDYVVAKGPDGETINLTAQQQSVKNIKIKVEAMIQERQHLIRRCQELDELTKIQEEKILALEAQFHICNSTNMSHGVALTEAASHLSLSPDCVSLAASTMSDEQSLQERPFPKRSASHDTSSSMSRATDAAASEIVRQSQELAKYKKQGEEHAKKVEELETSQKTHKDTITRLEAQKNKLSQQHENLKDNLRTTKELLEDAVVKRDEFKANLLDIITHYKELEIEHKESSDQITKLQSVVVKLESNLQETQKEKVKHEKQAKKEKKARQELEAKKTTESSKKSKEENSSTKDDSAVDCTMEDLLVAYAKAQKQIGELQDSLMKQELGKTQYRDTNVRFKQLERERNDFQRKLNKALEETKLAKQQAQKEKDESKLVRRQLQALLQNRDDETASLESLGNNSRRSASSRSRGSSRASSRSRTGVPTVSTTTNTSSHKKALVKKASFKPLTVEELMDKDFS